MKKKLIIIGVTVIVMALFSPVIARLGHVRDTATWKAPPGTWGLSKTLYIKAREMHPYLDLLRWYPLGQIRVTDGGYAYVLDLTLHDRRELEEASVDWTTEAVHIHFGSGLIITIPKGLVMQQIGP